MRALIISDDPESESFAQITALRQQIELRRYKVDLVVFQDEKIFLNRDKTEKKENPIELLKVLLREKDYFIIVISLKIKYLVQLFPQGDDFVTTLKSISPNSALFVFGASTILGGIKDKKNIFLYHRSGVTKTTTQFSNDIIDFLRPKK